MSILPFLLLASVGLLGVLGCLTALGFLFTRLLSGGERRERRSGGCLLPALAALVFVTLGGLGLAVAAGLAFVGTGEREALASQAIDWVPSHDVPIHKTPAAAETASAQSAPEPAARPADDAPTPRVVLRLTLEGTLEDAAFQDALGQRLADLLTLDAAPALRVETPPGLDVTLVEALLPLESDALQPAQAQLEAGLSDLLPLLGLELERQL